MFSMHFSNINDTLKVLYNPSNPNDTPVLFDVKTT